MSKQPDQDNAKRFDTSVEIRNFEIDLFWKRSLFFWGFISAAFVAYATLGQSQLRIVIACFGMVCSFAWAFVNRGSKYWQESWEMKVERTEPLITGVLFAQEEPRQSHKGWWLSGREYSVSKLAIALSDYIFLLWTALVVREAILIYLPSSQPAWLKKAGPTVFVIFSVVYLVLLFRYGRKSPRSSASGG